MVVKNIQLSDLKTFEGRAKQLYTIRTKNGDFVPFEMNESQKIIHNIVEEELSRSFLETGYPQCNLIILKARQVGCTTYFGVYNIDKMLLENAFNVSVLAHDDDSTNVIFTEKYRMMYEDLPDVIDIYDGSTFVKRSKFKPITYSMNGKGIRFSNMTRSALTVRTAGSGDNVGKGSSLNACHLTEFANYIHGDTVLSSLSQQVPRKGFGMIVIESTANGIQGIGEDFYDIWTKSVKAWNRYKNGEIKTFNYFRPVFIPFYILEEYRMPLVEGQLIDLEDIDWVNDDFRKIYEQREEYITEVVFKDDKKRGLEAINWYRWAIKNRCNSNILEAFRYYPILDIDAFTVTSNSYFNSIKLITMREYMKENGELIYDKGNLINEQTFEKNPYGNLVIWSHPDNSYMNRYVIGVDIASGQADNDGDFSVASVYDRLTDDFVAQYRGQISEDLFAEEVLKLAYYYNYAFIVPESNMSTLINLIKPGGLMEYEGDIYIRNLNEKGDFKYGFQTMNNTKKYLIDNYNIWLRNHYDSLKDLISIDEHLNFTKKSSKTGYIQLGAINGHDDIVIGRALAILGTKEWEEELAELNNNKTDIVRFIETPKHVLKFQKQSKMSTT